MTRERATTKTGRELVRLAFQRGVERGLGLASLRPRADMTHPAELPKPPVEVARRARELRRFLFRPFSAARAVAGWLA